MSIACPSVGGPDPSQFALLTPIDGHTASSSSLPFTWQGPAGSVYDLQGFNSIADRNAGAPVATLADGTTPFDKQSGAATDTSVTISGARTNGETIYIRLYRWPNTDYLLADREVIDFVCIMSTSAVDPNRVVALKALFDSDVADVATWYSESNTVIRGTSTLRLSEEGMYYKYESMSALAEMYRLYGTQSYLNLGIQHAQEIIAAGSDFYGSDGRSDYYYGNPGAPISPDHSNEHMEWRGGAGVANLLCAMLDSGLYGINHADVILLENWLEVVIWEKWTDPNPSTQLPSRGNVNTQGSWFAGRLGMVAIGLDKIKTLRGSPANTWNTYLTGTGFPGRIDDLITTTIGNYASTTDSHIFFNNTNAGVTNFDASHPQDTYHLLARMAQEGYRTDVLTQQFFNRLANHIQNVTRSATGTWRNNVDGSGGDASGNSNGYQWQGNAYIGANNQALLTDMCDQWLDGTHPKAMIDESRMLIVSGLISSLTNGPLGA